MNTAEQQKIAHELSVYCKEIQYGVMNNTTAVRMTTVHDIVYILCEVFKDADSTFSVTEFFNEFAFSKQKS